MDSLLRGEDMALSQIYFQSQVAYQCMAHLGELGLVQFRDLNPDVNAFQRKFVNEVRRCEELERKLRYVRTEIEKDEDIKLTEAEETCEAPKQKDFNTLETQMETLEHDLLEVNSNKDALKKNHLELIELRHILVKAAAFFEEHTVVLEQTSISMEGPNVVVANSMYRLGFIAGILNRDRVPSFELMLWRMCRGNVFLKTAEIDEETEDPLTGTIEVKTVFIIFFQGEQLKMKCRKICEGLKATIYPCPETQSERKEMLTGVNSRLDELHTVLDQSISLRRSLLINSSSSLNTWFCKVKKMKAIYHTMNMFKFDKKSVIAECWIPINETTRIKSVLDNETKKIDSNFQTILNIIPTKEQPPTYCKQTKVTAGFQTLVNSYGIPSYKEINPAPFAVITFPFLFAVMFGDAGHGFLALMAAAYMCKNENSIKKKIKGNEIFEIFFGGRYIILLMSMFSIYTGFLYNDMFSKQTNIFGSSWRVGVGLDFDWEHATGITLNPNPNATEKMYSGNPYPFGLDPMWQFGINKISFTNTMKMKFSIIIGIMQMIFGLGLGLLNHIYFKRRISIILEFIPQIIFITLIFVYLCFMILFKWVKYNGSDDPLTGACAPNLLIELINMFFLKNSALDSDGNINQCLVLYSHQHTIQSIFVVVAVLCIPVMLFGKPIYLIQEHKKKTKNLSVRSGDVRGIGSNGGQSINSGFTDDDQACILGNSNDFNNDYEVNLKLEDIEVEPEFEIGEIFVEQVIHTIEYFLGCISHTASYLRLWALSLAHAELSEVLWTMTMKSSLGSTSAIGPVMLFAIFPFWAVITVAILILMEGLSAFLHALRLHWVEFQSKFYKGEGVEFIPFSFEKILATEAD